MHIQGTPETMQVDPRYDDLVGEVITSLAAGIERALAAGVQRDRIWVDPGIGFGKTVGHNLFLLRHLAELRVLGAPILVGTSRKRFLGALAGGIPPEQRAPGQPASIAATAALRGADVVRVHDVAAVRQALAVADAIARAGQGGDAWALPAPDARAAGPRARRTCAGGSRLNSPRARGLVRGSRRRQEERHGTRTSPRSGRGHPGTGEGAARANLQDVRAEHARSLADPHKFWGEVAKGFRWSQPWSRVLEWRVPDHQWFIGAKTNITENALDRHADGPRRNHRAFICMDEDGTERSITYGELRDLVSRLASGLRSLGVGVGDRVIIYMPLTLEGIAAMLACARLGAIHSVIYAGLGAGRCGPHRRRRREGDHRRRRRLPARQGGGAQADRRRGDRRAGHVEQWSGSSGAKGGRPPLQGPREVDFTSCCPAQQARVAPVQVRQRAPALHPLHLGHHRQAEGRGPRPRRLHGRHRLPPRGPSTT